MTQLRRNVLANFAGRGWAALLGVVLLPLYIQRLGIAAYGLVGFFTTLQAVFALFDLGLSTTLNKELARLSVQEKKAVEARDLIRTLEVAYWILALLLGIGVLILAPLLAHFWLKSEQLSPSVVQRSLLLMGGAITLQFPFALYSGGLLGLQRQVPFNLLTIAIATVRGFGALGILWVISPTIEAYFVWQLLMNGAQTAICGYLLWRSLPARGHSPRFRWAVLGEIWRFAAGVTGISILAVLLTQMDKLVLSRILPLEEYGYYSLAAVVAASLLVIVSPINTAIFPRLSQLVTLGDEASLATLYHRSCQVLSVIVLPIATTIALFAPEMLRLWTRDELLTERTHLLVSLLVIGTALNGILTLPYSLQLAHSYTMLALYQNIVAVSLVLPLLFWVSRHYGAVGAAAIWPALNVGYLLISIPIMHRRMLTTEQWRWYGQDVALPLLGALLVGVIARQLVPQHLPALVTLLMLGGIVALSGLAALATTPLRSIVVARFAR